MSSAAGWNTTLPDSVEREEERGFAGSRLRSWWRGCLLDVRNIPRYVVRYILLALALLGAIQLFALKGDGPMPAFKPLLTSKDVDPYHVSSSHCMLRGTSNAERWAGLSPALALLRRTNPEVAQWVEETRADGRLVFTSYQRETQDKVNFLAKFDLFRRELRISPGLYAESDGAIAAILCHEYRHSRQGPAKVLNYALSFFFFERGDPSIVENDAVIYEQEARRAIFGEANDALAALEARLVAR